MIYAFICTKESVRFPGKNELLLPYTLAWLGYASMVVRDKVEIVSLGPSRPKDLPIKIRHITIDSPSHKAVIEYGMQAVKACKSDIFILPQLTHPIRRPDLLAKIIEKMPAGECSAVTVTRRPSSAWRIVDPQGRWAAKNEAPLPLHDGVLYAWRGQAGLDAMFDANSPHIILETDNNWGLVDIDHPSDLPPALPAIWASTLLNR